MQLNDGKEIREVDVLDALGPMNHHCCSHVHHACSHVMAELAMAREVIRAAEHLNEYLVDAIKHGWRCEQSIPHSNLMAALAAYQGRKEK